MKIENATKLVLLGGVIALLIVAMGKWNSSIALRNIENLSSKCVAERNKQLATAGKDKFDFFLDAADSTRFSSDLLLECDPNKLFALDKMPPGIQGEIVSANRERRESWELTLLIAIGVALISTIPSGWYFLLKRIEEIRKAITGR